LNGLREYKLYLADIKESILKIQSYSKGCTLESLKDDDKTYDSILLNFLVIGEAAVKIPDEIKNEHPDIDWRGMIGMRNIIAHGYFKIDPKIIWDSINKDLPILLNAIIKII
jgi:uncharacterized protein with HEPN domain